MSLKRITAELDEIAGQLQKKGLARMAASLDVVSNTLETVDQSKRRASRRRADQSLGLSLPGGGGGMQAPPGSEDADEDGRSDSYTAPAEIMHRVPVGKDSLSTAIGRKSPDTVPLDIAQEGHTISIQSKRKPKRRRATPQGNEGWLDPGDSDDHRSTAGLPETGNEDEVPPVDKDQEGDVLQFYGTDPAGTHAGGGRSSRRRSNMNEAKTARMALSRAATNVEVKDPNSIESDDPGDMVEESQSLGGLAGKWDEGDVVSMPDEMLSMDEGFVGAGDDDYDDEDDMDDEDDDMDDEDDEDDDMDDYDDEDEDDDYDDEDDYEDDMDDEDDDDEDDEDEDAEDESASSYASIEYP